MSISIAESGRAASFARRRALSAGKSALPPSTERIRDDERIGALTGAAIHQNGALSGARSGHANAPAPTPIAERAAQAQAEPQQHARPQPPAHELAKMRRANRARYGAGTPAAAPSAPEPPKSLAPASPTKERPRITGEVTPGRAYVTGEPATLAFREAPAKVSHARTASGLVVSGTYARTRSAITGDPSANGIVITGQSNPASDGDANEPATRSFTTAQFPSRAPIFAHGARNFAGTTRANESALEFTEAGLPVTGSAVGRSARVTGDEIGACRRITGAQYSAPGEARAECGGPARRDPVTGAKVVVGATRAGIAVSGIDVERNPRVTGGARGDAAPITGSQYTSAALAAPESRPPSLVTGDVPRHARNVTGTETRGIDRHITGTSYQVAPRDDDDKAALPQRPTPASIAERFSVRSPARAAQLRAAAAAPEPAAAAAASRVTGTFARGNGKLTGNVEFSFAGRDERREAPPARMSITGEGRTSGNHVTGGAWTEHAVVTGTEGTTASLRNPTRRGAKAEPFAGTRAFAGRGDRPDEKQLVTGNLGYSSDSSARVTLSGGARA